MNNRVRRKSSSVPEYNGQHITRVSDDVYEIESTDRSKIYTVNLAVAICTCNDGETGKICKHLHHIFDYSIKTAATRYFFSDNRALFYKVACGREAPDGWLELLHTGPANQNDETSDTNCTPNIASAVAVETETQNTNEKLESAISCFNELWRQKMEDCARCNAEQFLPGYLSAIAVLQKLSTDNAKVSALHSFGKLFSGSISAKRPKLSHIPVQTTAVARRRKCLRGRAVGEAGRPRKNVVITENKHDYCTYTVGHRKIAAAHNLSRCVELNVSLGRTHSKK